MLRDDIRAHWPLRKRLADFLVGGSLSRSSAQLVGESRLSELDSRQQVMRRGAELQAALEARATEIGAPPPPLESDIDSLLYAAVPESSPRPSESADPEGYYDWTLAHASRSSLVASKSYQLRLAVERGLLDARLQVGLTADELVPLLKDPGSLEAGRPQLATVSEPSQTPAPTVEPTAELEP